MKSFVHVFFIFFIAVSIVSADPSGQGYIDPLDLANPKDLSLMPLYAIADWCMCKDIQNYDPVNRSTAFLSTDTKACFWIQLNNVGSSHTVKTEFYEPGGSLYGNCESITQAPPPDPGYWSSYKLSCCILVNGYSAASKEGTWTTKCYIDGNLVKTMNWTLTLICNGPVASFSVNPTSGCAPLQVQIQDNSTQGGSGCQIVDRDWDLGDGTQLGNYTTINYTYANTGSYTISLTVQNNKGATDTYTQQVTVNQCCPDPQAEFSHNADNQNNCIPKQVQFSDQSTQGGTNCNIVSWDWNFGDGNSSNLQNPSHTFNDEGNFNVTLTVTNNEGDTDQTNQTIPFAICCDDPVAAFSAEPSDGCIPLEVQFTNQSTQPNESQFCFLENYIWNFGDGGTSTEENPSHTYTTAGNYRVTLTVENNRGGTDSEISNDNFIQAELCCPDPTANFSVDNDSGCVPFLVHFTDLSTQGDENLGCEIISWDWDFGDGGTSTDQHPEYTYNVPGLYSVSLTVTNSTGQTDTKTIDQLARKPGTQLQNLDDDQDKLIKAMLCCDYLVDFSVDHDTCCENEEIQFTSEILSLDSTGLCQIDSVRWDLDDDKTSSDRHPKATYSKLGGKTIILRVYINNGDIMIETKENFVHVIDCCREPTADFIMFGGDPCSWKSDNDDCYCSGTKIIFKDLSHQFPGEGCLGNDSCHLIQWKWDLGGIEKEGDSVEHTFSSDNADGEKIPITLTVYNCENDSSSRTDTLTIKPCCLTPQSLFDCYENDTSYVGKEVTFTCQSTSSARGDADCHIVERVWNFGDGSVTTADKTVKFTFTTEGPKTISLKVKDNLGQWSEEYIVENCIYIKPEPDCPPPVADFSFDNDTICVGQVVYMIDNSTQEAAEGTDCKIIQWDWDMGDGNTVSLLNPANANHAYTTAGSYDVILRVTNNEGEYSTSETKKIVVVTSNITLTLPYQRKEVPHGCCDTLTVQVHYEGLPLDNIDMSYSHGVYIPTGWSINLIDSSPFSIKNGETKPFRFKFQAGPSPVNYYDELPDSMKIEISATSNRCQSSDNDTLTYIAPCPDEAYVIVGDIDQDKWNGRVGNYLDNAIDEAIEDLEDAGYTVYTIPNASKNQTMQALLNPRLGAVVIFGHGPGKGIADLFSDEEPPQFFSPYSGEGIADWFLKDEFSKKWCIEQHPTLKEVTLHSCGNDLSCWLDIWGIKNENFHAPRAQTNVIAIYYKQLYLSYEGPGCNNDENYANSLTKIISVNQSNTEHMLTPCVSTLDDHYVVAWAQENGNGETDIYASLVAADGSIANYTPQLICSATGNQSNPQILHGSDRCLIIWTDERNKANSGSDIYGNFFKKDQSVSHTNGFTICDEIDNQIAAKGCNANGDFFVCWADRRNKNISEFDIYGILLGWNDENSEEILICNHSGIQLTPSAAFGDGKILISWSDQNINDSLSSININAAFYDYDDKTMDTTTIQVSNYSTSQFAPEIVYDNSNFIILWSDLRNNIRHTFDTPYSSDEDIYANRVSNQGVVENSNDIVICTVSNSQFFPQIVNLESNQNLIIWEDGRDVPRTDSVPEQIGFDIIGKIYGESNEININIKENNQQFADIAALNNQYLAAWSDGRDTTSDAAIYYTLISKTGEVLFPDGLRIEPLTDIDENQQPEEQKTPSLEKEELSKSYPNPFQTHLIVEFPAQESGTACLEIFNLLGNKIFDKKIKIQKNETYQVKINLNNYAAGLYFYRINLNNQKGKMKKITLIR